MYYVAAAVWITSFFIRMTEQKQMKNNQRTKAGSNSDLGYTNWQHFIASTFITDKILIILLSKGAHYASVKLRAVVTHSIYICFKWFHFAVFVYNINMSNLVTRMLVNNLFTVRHCLPWTVVSDHCWILCLYCHMLQLLEDEQFIAIEKIKTIGNVYMFAVGLKPQYKIDVSF